LIWQDCDGAAHMHPIQGVLHRLVESQEHIATLSYVDSLEEQAVLESLLDAAKPAWPPDSESYHYLLRTPFRYPPLPWGSRFGGRHEPSLLYGGLGLHTTLAEAAYYRFVFRDSMQATPPKEAIVSQHTLVTVAYRTNHGVRLQDPPLAQYADLIGHPGNYAASQALGTDMRETGVEAFEYGSARDPMRGLCVGLFVLRALAARRPRTLRPWLCELGADEVVFKPVGERAVVAYRLDDFLVDGALPAPA
jgi:hypothetical protein